MRAVFVASLIATALSAPAITPAAAASFDCGQAETPFEHAICDMPDLSAADDRLARTYATAIGGLSDTALSSMRASQRDWLDYAQRACTQDAKTLTEGRYDEDDIYCLTGVFDSRSRVLEQSRMIDGIRFYPLSRYEALPDTYELENNPDTSWPVAQHELSVIQIDGDDDLAQTFNALVDAKGKEMSALFAVDGGPDDTQEDSSSDSTISLSIGEIAGSGRVTLEANSYWYGHGAAHGNYTIDYHHYLVDEGRWLEAEDIFAGKGWRKALLDMAVEAARAEHGDNLMLDDTSYIADSVIDPTRWDLSSPYDLVIQFQPYEISAYAYGAPTARISWDALTPYLAENALSIRSGY